MESRLLLRLGQETADFIETHKDQPFLAYLSYYTVHAPIQSTQALENTGTKPKKMGLTNEKEHFFRLSTQCPSGTRLSNLCRHD